MTKIKNFLSKIKIKYNSPVILTYSIMALIVLGLGYITNNKSNILAFSVYRSSPLDMFFYIRLFGHILGHADWNHFFSNFFIILLIGPLVEEKYGSVNTLIMILFTAFVISIIHMVFFANIYLCGASGIVFMLIVLSSFVNFEGDKIPLTFILVVLLYLGREIFDLFVAKDNISQMAHIIGGICGAIFGYILNKKKIKKHAL